MLGAKLLHHNTDCNMSSTEEAIDLTQDDDNNKVVTEINHVAESKNKTFNCNLMGDPKAQQRARNRRGQGFYNPSKVVLFQYKMKMEAELRELMGKELEPNFVLFPKDTPVEVTIDLHMRRPNYHFQKGKQRCYSSLKKFARNLFWKPTGSDVDNMAKLVLDAMNKVVYYDDRQVVSLKVTKHYSNHLGCSGYTHVEAKELIGYNSMFMDGAQF